MNYSFIVYGMIVLDFCTNFQIMFSLFSHFKVSGNSGHRFGCNLFYFFPSHLPEIKNRLATIARESAPPPAMLQDVMMLGRGVAYRLECRELLAMRDALAETFTGLLTPQDQARPRLHITIQNKVEPAAAKRLYEELRAEFQPRPFSITGLSAYFYRGGPWQAIQSWSFSGRSR